MIKSEWLESFAVFGRCLNFTHAAEALHISQPALHVQIRQLGQQLGLTLYERHGKNLTLTEAGRKLLAYASDRQLQEEEFVGELTGRTTTPRVTLAAGTGALLYLLGPALSRFIRKQTAVLKILNLDAKETLAAVRHGAADIGITVLDTVPDDVTAVPLTDVWSNAVFLEGHRLARKRRVQLGDLSGERLILPPAGRVHRHTIERALAAAGVNWQIAVEANGWELMLHLANLGLGITIVNDFCRVPRNCVARRVKDLPSVRYYRITRRQRQPAASLVALANELDRVKR